MFTRIVISRSNITRDPLNERLINLDIPNSRWYGSVDYVTGEPCMRANYHCGDIICECVIWSYYDDYGENVGYSWDVFNDPHMQYESFDDWFDTPEDAYNDMLEYFPNLNLLGPFEWLFN